MSVAVQKIVVLARRSSPFSSRLLDHNPLLDRLKGLLVVWACRWLAKHQLGLELPGVRETPGGFHIRDNAGVKVEVLKIASKALGFESSPS